MRGIFTPRNLLYTFLILLFQVTAFQTFSQNNTTTSCSTPGGQSPCGSVDEDFEDDNGGFSSPNFTWSSSNEDWRVTVASNRTYTITSGLYRASANGIANIGFRAQGTGSDDITGYTINILNINGVVIASCAATFTNAITICRSLNDADIQNQTVRVEFVFTTDGNAAGTLSFVDFRTNMNQVNACNATNNNCFAQNQITDDFNDGNRGDFLSTNGFVYNPGTNGNGFFQIPAPTPNNPTSNRQFSLISGRFQVAAASLTVTAGFSYTGGLNNDIDFLIVNIRNDANDILATCTFDDNIDDDENEICVTLNDIDLVGQAIRVEFVFDTDGNTNGDLRFDDFRINLPVAAPLPVDFTSFTAEKAPTGVQLLWTVANEVNVDRYEIERSSDGSSFTKIGTIPATASPRYSFTDKQSHSTVVYYRVRNVDLDGTFAYTSIVKYKNGHAEVLSKVFPTTTRGQVTLQHAPITGKAQIIISSLEGRILRNLVPVKGSTTTRIDLSAYATGTYLLRLIKEDSQSETFKVIKQ